jgi:ankyrin repeat protein
VLKSADLYVYHLTCFRFRWVSLQIQNLCDSQRMKIEDDIDHELGRLPQTLADLYAVIYKQISQTGFNGRLIAERALKWLLCAQESLSTEKFIAAVSVGSGKYTPLTNENILGLCCNFVVLDTELDTFRFTHLSVREYLEGRPEYAVNEINALAMERCLEVYLYNQRTVHALEPTAEQHNQLCRYATLYWPSHYQNLDEKWRKEYFSIKVEKFLFQGQDVNPSFTKWIQNILQFCELTSRFGPNRDSRYISFKHRLRAVYSSPPTPLFTACIFGFFEILEKLNTIENNNWNQKNSEGYNALHLAIRSGHDAVVKLLLEKGAELESKDTNFGQTPLSLAAENGNDAVVKLLLEKGAELESKNTKFGQTPLSLAAENGHDAVVKLLLEKGAELEAKNTYSRTPLSLAAEKGHNAVVKLLLEEGAELESKNTYGLTPLSLAAENGHDAVVKLLLEKGAEQESKDTKYGQTPLSWAVEKGHEAVAKLLLENGAELESKDALRGQTPLSLAARNGHDAVVKLLLEKGAELESKDTEFNRTPLSWAARYGHDAVVKLLLEKGTKLETKDTVYGLTPLSLANRYGHDEVVKLLLEKGAKKP